MTMLVYTYDNSGVFSGAFEVLDPKKPVPTGTQVPPPATSGSEVAVFGPSGWTILPEYPFPAFDRHTASSQIDEAVAAIYGRFTRFQLEYTEREAQAQAYKDSGYIGEVPARVAEFATPSGMSAQAATDLILQQAANLRTAQGALSALRMRKYEVLHAATDAEAQALAVSILKAVETIGVQVT